MIQPNLLEIHKRTIEVYEKHASAWDEQRPTVFFEKNWIDRFIACLPPEGEVLDVGCGSGVPIAQYLLEKNFQVTGVDAAPAMVNISASRFPQGKWIVMDIRSLSLSHRFDGIVGWDSFFHLAPAEQRAALEVFCRHLKQNGALLLTIGHKAGEVLGMVDGQQVYHASLDPTEYDEILSSAGFAKITLELCDEDCGGHSLLLASGYKSKQG
ncbi:MAG: class I SAM-dependent methyltransferase [Desulfocapsaceae bacterium]|nr:class I SAM-dependent methyltransferase [Desulfocapsaceae bacterium]